ncbi:phage tail sheath family protein [Zoogloea sp.]|uniref:phage tail sheath family protein n=1 Tax=Zoogloea sp. TaxID=49181 RepID=UPI0035B1F2E1
MPEYLAPGVFIEEIERGPRPIEGVPTSTAAFLGETERGPIRPRLVTSYSEYRRWFGGTFGDGKYMPYATSGFFENGGSRLYVCRIVPEDAEAAELDIGNNFVLRACGAGTWGDRIVVWVGPSTTRNTNKEPIGFRLRVALLAMDENGQDSPFQSKSKLRVDLFEDFDDLVVNESSPNYYGKRLPHMDETKGERQPSGSGSALIVLVRTEGASSDQLPELMDDSEYVPLSGGNDGSAIGSDDFQGLIQGNRKAFQGLSALLLDPYRDVALVHAPGQDDPSITNALISHCENQRFRFAVIDCKSGTDSDDDLDPRTTITDSSYAAYYYPWITVADPQSGARKLVPPGGHTLGVYARTDSERGVFKSPANEILRGALDLQFDCDEGKQGALNPRGVNVTRRFPGRGIRVWGARTISSNALWKYVAVRRLFIFLERSIYEGTQWVVFEPNDDRLWARVKDTIRLFLRTQWRNGALFGQTESEAFTIACDRSTMTQDDILNGRLVCEIGIAPVRPAEFVIFRIFQSTAEAQR